MPEIAIHQCSNLDQPGRLALRMALRPHITREEHVAEMVEMLRKPEQSIQLLACADDGAGLLELSIVSDECRSPRGGTI